MTGKYLNKTGDNATILNFSDIGKTRIVVFSIL